MRFLVYILSFKFYSQVLIWTSSIAKTFFAIIVSFLKEVDTQLILEFNKQVLKFSP